MLSSKVFPKLTEKEFEAMTYEQACDLHNSLRHLLVQHINALLYQESYIDPDTGKRMTRVDMEDVMSVVCVKGGCEALSIIRRNVL